MGVAPNLEGNKILREAVAATAPRNNWTREEISAIFNEPLIELVHQAVSHYSLIGTLVCAIVT